MVVKDAEKQLEKRASPAVKKLMAEARKLRREKARREWAKANLGRD
jgi:hypothetical protein